MTIWNRPAPGREPCRLQHHYAGRPVSWQRWNRETNSMDTFHGVVREHVALSRFIVIDSVDGAKAQMPCGSVAPWRVTA